MNELTADETSNLFMTYITNSMASNVSANLLKKEDDPWVKQMLDFALKLANYQVYGAENFLLDDGQTLPEPFTKKDIVLKNKRYCSTNFVVLLKFSLAQDSLNVLGLALSTSIRPEVREFYKTCLNKTADLVDMCLKLKVKLGLHQPLIYLPENPKVDKVDKQAFLGKLLGGNRNLTASEVLQLTNNYRAIEVTREVCRSFSQSMNTELKAHYERGIEMCKDHLESIKSKLDKDELPQLPTWESEIDTEGGAPFSERLMLFKTANLMSAAAGRYGVSASSIFRKDLGALFLKLMGGILIYAEDTSNLLIKHHMWDHPPLLKKK